MCSTPPASTTSAAPSAISPAAAVTAVSAPAHIRSTAKPGTVSGMPARRATSRPRVRPWSPTWAVAASTTSPIPPDRIGDVVLAATAQVGDQGLTLGRDVALLAGIPDTVPGFAVDRMCAGALTAVTAAAGEIALGAVDVALAGGVEHMGHHPMGADVDFNPRFVSERLIDESAATMGQTAENLHDRFPAITRERADAFALQSQQRAAAAWGDSVVRETVVPMAVFGDDGWKVAERDEFLRPDTSLEGLAALQPAFRAGGRVTAGNSAGLTDGATAAFLAAEETLRELDVTPKLRLVGYAYTGVE